MGTIVVSGCRTHVRSSPESQKNGRRRISFFFAIEAIGRMRPDREKHVMETKLRLSRLGLTRVVSKGPRVKVQIVLIEAGGN